MNAPLSSEDSLPPVEEDRPSPGSPGDSVGTAVAQFSEKSAAMGERPDDVFARERRYLQQRLEQIERGLGALAARHGTPTPSTQQLEALERGRQLAAELLRQIRVRSLEEAIQSRLDWLERAAARRAQPSDEALPELQLLDLDRRLLAELLAGWRNVRR